MKPGKNYAAAILAAYPFYGHLSYFSTTLHSSSMPQHKSAAKRVRQSAKRRLRNRYHRARVRTMIKDLHETTNREEADPKLNAIKAQLDRMATKRLVHPNMAANLKGRLEKYVHTLG